MTINEFIEALKYARKEAKENDLYITDDGDEVCSLKSKYDEIIELAKQIDKQNEIVNCEMKDVYKEFEDRIICKRVECSKCHFITPYPIESNAERVSVKLCANCGAEIRRVNNATIKKQR